MNEQALTEKQQRIRRKQTLMGAGVYLSAIIPLYFIYKLDMIRLSAFGMWVGLVAAVITSLIFYLLIRFDWNLRLREPGMTFQQVLAAGFWSLIIAWNVDQEARMLPVVWLLLAFLFGVYTLKTRQYLLMSALILLGYFTLVIDVHLDAPGGRAAEIEFMHWVTLATGLAWMSLVGGYVSMLRRRLAERKAELSELAYVDPLTHVHNRRHAMETLEKEIARVRRGNSGALSVALVDVDKFKHVNDEFGHLVGDQCLYEIAQGIKEELRIIDSVGRYGGEEFLLIFPDTPAVGAAICCERIRERIESESAESHPEYTLTISIGIAQLEAEDTLESLLDRADKLLYEAKESGRNCIRLSDEEAVQPA